MEPEQLIETAAQVLDLAKTLGADQTDVMVNRSTDFEVKVADGEIVTLTQAASKGLGTRVFVEGRMGFCTTCDFTKDSLRHAVQRAVDMAKEAHSDPHNGLPSDLEPGHLRAGTQCDLYDDAIATLETDEKIRWAHALEEAARAADPRVTKFRDSGVATGISSSVLATSTGAIRSTQATGITLWSNPIAVDPNTGALQTEVWYDVSSHVTDVQSIESIGHTAGTRAARMLGAKPVQTQTVPVIFEPHMAAGLAAGILGAIDGDMVYKKASFLANKRDCKIASESLTFIDDPLMRRGIATSPFDGEGRPTATKSIVDAGYLTTFLYDTYTARKAGTKPTCNARRSYMGLPHAGPFNYYVQNGSCDVRDIIGQVKKGLLVTQGLGGGVNSVTGEYSRGANGLWIENGEITHPVQEITIAGDFTQILMDVDAVGNDFQMRGSTGAPTIRVGQMMVSGT